MIAQNIGTEEFQAHRGVCSEIRVGMKGTGIVYSLDRRNRRFSRW